MVAPCQHDPPIPKVCRLCKLLTTDARYQALWANSEPIVPPQAPTRSLPCIFLGDVRDRLGCSCPGRWLRGCDLHETTTINSCKTCTDYLSE